MEEQSDYDRIFRPPDLESFYQGNFDVLLKIWRQGAEFETLSLGTIPGFYTIQDVKRLIYNRKRTEEYIPRFVFMGIPVGNPSVEPSKSTRYQAADFSWIRDKAEPPNLQSPIATLTMADPRFADATGQWGTYKENRRDGVTLEEAPIVRNAEGNVVFHVFSLSRLLSAFQRPRPISLADWNTRFAMFFPRVPPSGPKSTPTEQDQNDMRDVQTYLLRRQQRVDMLEALLTTTPTPEATIKGVQRLRFTLKPAPQFNSVEMLFYTLPVSHRVPFLRLLKPSGEPINKLFTRDSFYPPRPDVEDPNFLRQWAQQEAPEPSEDFMFSKILIREIRSSQKPLYGTHRVFEDGSSDIVILPLRQERLLNMDTDLGNLYEQLEEALEGTNTSIASAKLGDMTAVFQIELDAEDVKIDRKELERRLPCFSPFFQLTPVYSSELPQLMVRYKAVSNFAVENFQEKKSNINTYIKILAERDRAKGEDKAPAAWIPKIAEEFQISISEATEHLRDLALKLSEFVLVTQDDILEGNHQGIDIAIFENHPTYSFHVYGINHPNHLMRIVALMRLLLGLPSDQLVCSTKAAESYSLVEQSIGAGSDEAAPMGSAAAGAGGAGYNVSNMAMNADEGIVDFTAIGEEEEAGGAEQNNAAGAAAAAEEAAPEEEEAAPTITEEELKGKTSKDAPRVDNYILNLLLKSDPELFDYKRGPSDQPYSRKCQATMDAQPIVMTKQQFEKNYKLYQEDCIVFPLRGEAQPPIIEKTDEKFLFMRYGTSPDKDLYYVCPPIFCVRDFLIIRRDEFKSSMGRDGKRKDPFTCPFCRGTIIKNKKEAVINATVIVRPAKNHATLKYDGRDKTLQYIGFHKDDSHPKGFRFPCCFLKPPTETLKGRKSYTLTADNPVFSDQTKWLRKGLLGRMDINTVVEDAEAEAEEGEQKAADTDEEIERDYGGIGQGQEEGYQLQTRPREFQLVLQDLPNEYIQEANKALNHGKVALLTKSLSSYFEQDSKTMVKVISSKQTLTPNAQGFLRVGVGNTPRNRPDSLFGCLAPLLGTTVISQVKEIILSRITPRIFIHLNYGNLVHEYFDPSDPEPEGDVMAKFAADHLNLKNDPTNKMAISRFFRSYNRFKYEVRSTTSRKQLRVFSDILQHPNLLYSPGTNRCLVLIVLEADVLKPDAAVRVLCPPYGISPYARDNADFAFIVRFMGDGVNPYYEPLIYTENFPATATRGPIHRHNFIFQRSAISDWSKSVKPRIMEFLTKCEGPGRQLYASKTGIDPYAMISISQLKTFLGVGFKALGGLPLKPMGILRDSHNHVAGLLYQKSSRFIMVPCVDDGYIYPEIPNVELDFEGFPPATVDEIEAFYKLYVSNRFNALYPGYEPKAQVRTKYDKDTVAVELSNGLLIPALPAKKSTTLPQKVIEAQLQWRINKLIIDDEAEAPANQLSLTEDGDVAAADTITMEHVNELYEHFRVSFANWLMGQTAAKVKESIQSILKNPAYDLAAKRKNLDIFLRSTIEKWLDPDDNYEVVPFEYLRRDCISIDTQDKCSGVCRWRTAEEPKCRIHVPVTSGERKFNTVELFCQRLYDELIRVPFKRRELLNNHVSHLNPPTEAIYDQTLHQWILPDNSADWITLKRMEWKSEKFDEPRFFEEMSSEPNETKTSEFLSRLAPELVAFLGTGAEKLFQWQPPASDTATKEPYIVFAPMLGFGFSDPDMGLPRDSFTMTQEVATKAARKAGKMLIFANMGKNSVVIGRPAQTKSYILFVEQEGQIPSLIVSSPRSSGMAFEDLPATVQSVIAKTAPKQTIKLARKPPT